MTTTMTPLYFQIPQQCTAQALQEAGEKLDSADVEVTLDFSAVNRIDPGALRAMEKLASTAEEKSVTIFLRGANIDIYKVLKLARLARRFSFVG
ncbi:MAG: STAS domain-containing protein [Candidatus Korobacteraceae bacterium]